MLKSLFAKNIPCSASGVISKGTTQHLSCKSTLLPHDIIECVIDYLKDDTPTLKQCALISNDWVFPSQRNLFSRVRIRPSLNGSQPPFLEYLYGPTCLGSHVKTLEIRGGKCTPAQVLEWVDKLLPNLRIVLLLSVGVFPSSSPSSDSGLNSAPPPHRHLDTLDAFACQLGSVTEGSRPLFELINLFSSITELRLMYLWNGALRESNPLPPIALSELRPSVRKTKVNKMCFSPDLVTDLKELYDNILGLVDMGHLSELVIFPLVQRPLHACQELINAATNLKHVTTETGSFGQTPPQILSLSPLSSLNTIEFTHCLERCNGININDRSFRTYITRATSLLTSLCSPPPHPTPGQRHRTSPCAPLSRVRFKTRVEYSGPFKPEEVFPPILQRDIWSGLGSALDPFSHLQHVEVFFFISRSVGTVPTELVPVPYPESLDLIREQLVGTARRSAVVVEVIKEISQPPIYPLP